MRSARRLRALALLCLLAGRGAGQPQDAAPAEDGTPLEPWWERLKDIPLAADSRWRWSAGAELRARYEGYANDAWDDGPDADHDYVWLRALPYVELAYDEELRARLELISAVESGDEAGASPVDEDRADVLQAFAELRVPAGAEGEALTLRGGRQILSFGSERLISARYGPNVPRSFDAADLVLHLAGWRVDLLFGRPVENETGAFDDGTDGSRAVWTAYGAHALGDAQGIDLYYIGFEDDAAAFNQGSGAEERHTLGARIFGRERAWDWNFELFGQAGSFGDGDVRAWSVASDTGRVLGGLPLLPRLGLKANVISGDDDPGDPDLQTFNPLFPKGKYFGEAGLIGPYNLLNVHPSLELALTDRWELSLAAVLYWRESTGDGVYDAAGNLLRPDGGTEERFIGSQYDAVLGYAPSAHLDVSLGCSAFVPGAFIESTGPDETVLFAGLEVRFSF